MTVDDLIAQLEALKRVHPSAGAATVKTGKASGFSPDRVRTSDCGRIVVIDVEESQP